MRISDWSSDVCSADLHPVRVHRPERSRDCRGSTPSAHFCGTSACLVPPEDIGLQRGRCRPRQRPVREITNKHSKFQLLSNLSCKIRSVMRLLAPETPGPGGTTDHLRTWGRDNEIAEMTKNRKR